MPTDGHSRGLTLSNPRYCRRSSATPRRLVEPHRKWISTRRKWISTRLPPSFCPSHRRIDARPPVSLTAVPHCFFGPRRAPNAPIHPPPDTPPTRYTPHPIHPVGLGLHTHPQYKDMRQRRRCGVTISNKKNLLYLTVPQPFSGNWLARPKIPDQMVCDSATGMRSGHYDHSPYGHSRPVFQLHTGETHPL